MPHIEAGPLPVMEAMACGVPVISTKVGWAFDYCEHDKNIVFVSEEEAQDAVKLSKIIKGVYDDESYRSRLRENALDLIKNFSIEKYCENLMNAYEAAYNKKNL